jgi:hypothetical protein
MTYHRTKSIHTPAIQSFKLGGGSFGLARPNNRFIIKTDNYLLEKLN